MSGTNKTFLIEISVLLLAGILWGCGSYNEKIIVSNEAAAIQGLRTIYEIEQVKYSNSKRYVSLDQLFSGENAVLSPARSNLGYRFEVRPSEDGRTYEAFATPTDYARTGRHSFYCTENGVIHSADKGGHEASGEDPEVK